MATDAISVGIFLIKTILKMVEEYQELDTEVKKLIERVRSLEKPLEVLQSSCPNPDIYKDTLRRLNSVLDTCNRFISLHGNRDDKKKKLAQFLKGESLHRTCDLLNQNLGVCLNDLQAAVQAAEVINAQNRVGATAQATVDLMALEKRKQAMETIEVCVQCGKDFKESENPFGGCKYHSTHSTYSNRGIRLNCCDKEYRDSNAAQLDGCTRGKHIAQHHSYFPYLGYFIWMRQQSEEEKETWLSAKQLDLEDDMAKWAKFGVMKNGDLFFRIGKGNFNLFLILIRPSDIVDAVFKNDEKVDSEETVVGIRGSYAFPGELDESTDTLTWQVKGEWVLTKGKISGFKISVKSLSSTTTLVKEIDIKSLIPLEKGAIKAAAKSTKSLGASKYVVPAATRNFTPFPDSIFQAPAPFDDSPTSCSTNLKLRLKNTGPCQANPNSSGFTFDTFVNEIMVMNLAKGETGVGASSAERVMILNMVKDKQISVDEACKLLGAVDTSRTAPDDPVTIIECRTDFLVKGEWVRSRKTTVSVDGKGELPFTVGPKAVAKVTVSSVCDAPTKSGSWINRAYTSRLEPISMRLTFETMEGQVASKNIIYRNPATDFPTKKPTDLFFTFCDDTLSWERGYVRITPPEDNKETALFTVNVNGSTRYTILLSYLQSWAYKALKEFPDKNECELSDLSTGPVKTTGILDTASKLVVGFRFNIKFEANDTRPEQSASETYMIPEKVLNEAFAKEKDEVED